MNETNINLVSPEKTNVKERNRVLVLRWISLIFLASVTFFSIILFLLSQRISTDSIKNEENAVLQKTSLLSERKAKYILLNDRLKAINSLLASRKNYITIVNLVESSLPESVSIKSFSLDKEGVSLLIASNSLLPINQFLETLSANSEKKTLRELTIEGLTVDNQKGIYSLSLKAKPI